MNKAIAAIALLLFAVSCAKTDAAATSSAASAKPAAPAAASGGPGKLTGTVAETFNGGGYTYLRVSTPSGDEWAAVPEVTVEKGQHVTLDVQMTMEQFESKTLGRTFDRIAFASMPGNAPKPASASQHMQAPDLGSIDVDQPAGGTSVAEIYARKNALAGKQVLVRGKVVKYLGGIMGTNWMHLQDGTGSKSTGDHDLTVTTDAAANVGDVVTVKGTLTVDKDFGSGYVYAVIVEKGEVVK